MANRNTLTDIITRHIHAMSDDIERHYAELQGEVERLEKKCNDYRRLGHKLKEDKRLLEIKVERLEEEIAYLKRNNRVVVKKGDSNG